MSNGDETIHPKFFVGYRPEPPEEYKELEITNAGKTPDFEGIQFSDGTVVLRWLTEYRSHSIWPDFDTFLRVHGHPEYGTRIYVQGIPDPKEEAEKAQA